MLDALACSLLDGARQAQIWLSHTTAAYLAVNLVYQHELFHARVEAVATWQELLGVRSHYNRYQDRVYKVLSGTSDWLEEALANWWAWLWFRSERVQLSLSNRGSNHPGLASLVEDFLDLSPPGYREWRIGRNREAWRTLATQLASGNPKLGPRPIGLPIESAVRGELPFDLLEVDVPTRVVGKGTIASHLERCPGTFSPSRREAKKLLKHFDYKPRTSAGKGSHEKWTGADGLSFILPRKDPLSIGIFHQLLRQLRISKAQYVAEIRNQL